MAAGQVDLHPRYDLAVTVDELDPSGKRVVHEPGDVVRLFAGQPGFFLWPAAGQPIGGIEFILYLPCSVPIHRLGAFRVDPCQAPTRASLTLSAHISPF